MPLQRLDHVNIRTANLDAMIAWYTDVLEMRSGKRPQFAFPGAWMYVGDYPIVHLVGVAKDPASIAPKIEHYAISGTGMADMVARLKDRGIAHTLDPVPGFPIVQINLRDCDGNHIHLDYADSEAEGLL